MCLTCTAYEIFFESCQFYPPHLPLVPPIVRKLESLGSWGVVYTILCSATILQYHLVTDEQTNTGP